MTLSHEGVALPVNLSHAPDHTVALSHAGVVLNLGQAGVVLPVTFSHADMVQPVTLSHACVVLRIPLNLSQSRMVLPVTLSHAGVVHHEEIHFEVVCAGPLDLVVL